MSASPDERPLRIVLTGAESTGKTELAAWLATHLDAAASAEYAREYAQTKGGAEHLAAADVEPIARGQLHGEDAAIAGADAAGRAYVVHDTDLLSTITYAEHYYGAESVPAWVHTAAGERRPDLYLICETDVAFEPDAARDPLQDRDALQQQFREAVAGTGVPWACLTGPAEDRQAAAVAAIREMLSGALARG